MYRDFLDKFSRAPGLCTAIEIEQARAFLELFKEMRDKYLEAFINEPAGKTLESQLATVDWYVKRARENPGINL